MTATPLCTQRTHECIGICSGRDENMKSCKTNFGIFHVHFFTFLVASFTVYMSIICSSVVCMQRDVQRYFVVILFSSCMRFLTCN